MFRLWPCLYSKHRSALQGAGRYASFRRVASGAFITEGAAVPVASFVFGEVTLAASFSGSGFGCQCRPIFLAATWHPARSPRPAEPASEDHEVQQ